MRDGFNFTERVRHVLQLARDEAVQMRHEYVGTEHILLGLLREGHGVAVAALTALGVKPEDLRQKVEEIVKQGMASAAAGPELPYTSRSKKVLDLAMLEAREQNHSYVGTEHLLVGLLREKVGIGAQVLADAGVTLDRVRDEIRVVTNTGEGSGSRAAPAMRADAAPQYAGGRYGPGATHVETIGVLAAGRLAMLIAALALVVAFVALVRTFR